jgi:drug/metabolite transporter (DMT)-like permease
MSCVQFITATVINSILALVFESPLDFAAIRESLFPLLFLGIGSSGIAYTCQIIGQRGVNPAAASILMSLESVFGVVGSALFLGEKMSGREYIGCIAVFAAVILSQIEFKGFSKKTRHEEAS